MGRARDGVRAVAPAQEVAGRGVGRTLNGSSMIRGTGSGPAGTGILVVRPLEVTTCSGLISKSVTSSSVRIGCTVSAPAASRRMRRKPFPSSIAWPIIAQDVRPWCM